MIWRAQHTSGILNNQAPLHRQLAGARAGRSSLEIRWFLVNKRGYWLDRRDADREQIKLTPVV